MSADDEWRRLALRLRREVDDARSRQILWLVWGIAIGTGLAVVIAFAAYVVGLQP